MARVSTWSGVTVTNNRVTGLQMLGNNATGFIPSNFKNLDSMLFIDFVDNGFRGDLLTYVSFFSELVSLHIGEQFLTGLFPTSLGYLPKLQSMIIYGPNFTRSIPATFENLISLTFLDIGYSAHSGDLPAEEPYYTKFWCKFANNNSQFIYIQRIGTAGRKIPCKK